MTTPHNSAKPGEIAEKILLPGDPLRAQYIAETYLEEVKPFNGIRNMLGFTGRYQGQPVSVMGTGMGMPSLGIYVYELIHVYGVKQLIRVGSAGAYSDQLKLYDLVLAQGACTDSNFAHQYGLEGTYSAIADWDLLYQAYQTGCKAGLQDQIHVGNIFSSDLFYNKLDREGEAWKRWADMGCLAVEMESYALYALAAEAGVQALTLLTISDSLVTGEAVDPEKRANSFDGMIRIALQLGQ